MMIVDVILPTFNREALLARTLESLLAAEVPPGLEVRVLVVDNGSTDGTTNVVRGFGPRFQGRLRYLHEPQSGKPYALNAGIAATSGDLVALIDDDEEVSGDWFALIEKHFREDPRLDFIGGKCLPLWGAPRPAWLGDGYLGVIGWVDPGPHSMVMDASYPGILMGGNAVIRRDALTRAGKYSTALSRTGTRLLGCEDEDMYHRLLARGAYGRYVPDLVIFHHVPPARLTRGYFRTWCFWRGVSLGVMDRSRPAPVTYLAGIPRHMIGRAARSALRMLASPLRRNQETAAERFERELACVDLAGFAWGKHVYERDHVAPASAEPRLERKVNA